MKGKINYTELLARAAEEDPVIREILESERGGVDYEAEYREQTGKNLATGEIEVQ